MRLLLVEDDPDLSESLIKLLREEGYAVDHASHGKEGLEKAFTWDYDALILDVMLPGISGWEFLHEFRHAKTTPVLMLTALDATPDKVKGLDTGADDYLTKPFDIEELLARIRALIRRHAGKSTSVLQIGPLTLNTALRTAMIDHQEISLTAREYSLLEYLVIHRGEIVTRTALYDHLFDEEEMTLSNLLDVHISNLRKKLGHDLIVTRRGHGYCIP